MPRVARIIPEEGVVHVMSRGNNRQKTFKESKDFERYLFFLKFYKIEHPFDLYHYCLMSNHVHLILRIFSKTNLSGLMKKVNLSYVHYYRKKYGYVGHFWQGWFKSLLISEDEYLLMCGRYVELNPVRANIVKQAEDYRWSSARHYLNAQNNDLLSANPLYELLGKTVADRQKIFRNFLINDRKVDLNVRFLGSVEFIEKMEQQFGVVNQQTRRGRPRKNKK